MIQNTLARIRGARTFAALALAVALFGLPLVTHADPPAPPTTGSPAPAAVVAPPVEAPAPPPANPAPAAVAPATRKEDESAPQTPQAAAPKASIFDRAAALMKGKDALAAQIAGLERERDDFKAQLGTATATIATLNAELAELRAGKSQIEAALQTAEGEKKTVAETVAGLGFPPAKLPNAQSVEEAGESEEGLMAAFRAETDPVKRADIAAQMRASRERGTAKA